MAGLEFDIDFERPLAILITISQQISRISVGKLTLNIPLTSTFLKSGRFVRVDDAAALRDVTERLQVSLADGFWEGINVEWWIDFERSFNQKENREIRLFPLRR
jgi:hypothetical protein